MAPISISHIGVPLASGWVGGVLAPNGNIYGIPTTANQVLKIDPITDTVTTFGDVGATSGASTSNSYVDGILVGTDIYCVPHDGEMSSAPVLVIHTANDTLSAFGGIPGQSHSGRYSGGVKVGSRIWLVPDFATPSDTGSPLRSIDTTVPQVDVHGNTVGLGDTSLPRWWRGVLHGTDIYCGARHATGILKIDTSTGTATKFGSISGTDKWRQILSANGLLWLIPNNDQLRTIDPTTDTISLGLGPHSGFTAGRVAAFDGLIYCAGGYKVLQVDPTVASSGGGLGQTLTNFSGPAGSGYSDLVEIPGEGLLYGIPAGTGSSQQVLRINLVPSPPGGWSVGMIQW